MLKKTVLKCLSDRSKALPSKNSAIVWVILIYRYLHYKVRSFYLSKLSPKCDYEKIAVFSDYEPAIIKLTFSTSSVHFFNCLVSIYQLCLQAKKKKSTHLMTESREVMNIDNSCTHGHAPHINLLVSQH